MGMGLGMRLKDKIALVVGSSSGLGLSIAELINERVRKSSSHIFQKRRSYVYFQKGRFFGCF